MQLQRIVGFNYQWNSHGVEDLAWCVRVLLTFYTNERI